MYNLMIHGKIENQNTNVIIKLDDGRVKFNKYTNLLKDFFIVSLIA